MKKNKYRIFIYLISIVVFIVFVKIKIEDVKKERNRKTASTYLEKKEFGWPVTVVQAKYQEMEDLVKLTATLTSTDILHSFVPLNLKQKLKEGLKVDIKNKKKWWRGRILDIGQKIDHASGLYSISIKIEDINFPHDVSKKFFNILVKIPLNEKHIVIPSNSLVLKDKKSYAWKIEKDNKVLLSPIVLKEIKNDTSAFILRGVSLNDLIVTTGLTNLKNHDKVRIIK